MRSIGYKMLFGLLDYYFNECWEELVKVYRRNRS